MRELISLVFEQYTLRQGSKHTPRLTNQPINNETPTHHPLPLSSPVISQETGVLYQY